jgi:hypothetical protein
MFMQSFLDKFDWLASIEADNIKAKWLERVAFFFLILMCMFAPHSIAASQTAWLIGMFAWIIRLFIKPRPKFIRTALDVPLWAFFVWSVVSSVFSYAPDVSINKLRGAALFLIFYFVINNLRAKRAVRFLALALVVSCMVNVVWMPIQRAIGRGVEIHGVSKDSPLAKAALTDGDALLDVDGRKLGSPDDLVREIERSDVTKVKFYRPDYENFGNIRRENLLAGETALEKLGIESWKKSRNWRSAGFFGHYATYAEVLQLILSLAFGLFIANFFPQRRKDAKEEDNEDESKLKAQSSKLARVSKLFTSHFSLFTFLCVGLMSVALLLTVTRASQLGFLVSAVVAVVASGRRKLILGLAVIILPVAIGGLVFLQQSRNVGFFDAKDDSTIYRETMWRDGFRLWTESPRNFTVGVGMDSIQRYWQNWNLYDGGRLPQGHFHSTPLQLAVERGLPALLIWLWIVGVYALMLIRYFRFQISNSKLEDAESGIWNLESGIVLGSLGGLAGFFTSGLVHYNLGDQEVAMIFFILMGLSVFLCNSRFQIPDWFLLLNLEFEI